MINGKSALGLPPLINWQNLKFGRGALAGVGVGVEGVVEGFVFFSKWR
jgi:hypothetical protein